MQEVLVPFLAAEDVLAEAPFLVEAAPFLVEAPFLGEDILVEVGTLFEVLLAEGSLAGEDILGAFLVGGHIQSGEDNLGAFLVGTLVVDNRRDIED